MRTDFQHLLIQQTESIVTITMNRPEVLNAFNNLMLQELTEALEAAAADEAIRCVVITGAGRAFGSGQDLSELSAVQSESEKPISSHLDRYHRVVRLIHEMPKPVIAAIRGVAAGISCNIALACDLRIAADDARFIEAFARIGLVPDGGGGYFLPRLIGLGKALEMAMLAEEVSGPEAERIGLVNRCVPVDEFETATMTLAQKLAQGPKRAYGLIKELMYGGLDCDLAAALKLEGELQDIAVTTEDFREGVSAFLQKRRPRYSGK